MKFRQDHTPDEAIGPYWIGCGLDGPGQVINGVKGESGVALGPEA